jgi:hypothetical protein
MRTVSGRLFKGAAAVQEAWATKSFSAQMSKAKGQKSQRAKNPRGQKAKPPKADCLSALSAAREGKRVPRRL